MAKTGRNDPCPCGSGKKYKKCCLYKESKASEQSRVLENIHGNIFADIEELDNLSNSVIDLIAAGKLDEAESVCHELKRRYPDQIDGIEKMAAVYEARGENQQAAEYYMKTAEFMRSNPGFDKEGIEWALNKAKSLKDTQTT